MTNDSDTAAPPLRDAERKMLADALGCEYHDGNYGECACCSAHAEQVWDEAVGQIVAARLAEVERALGGAAMIAHLSWRDVARIVHEVSR